MGGRKEGTEREKVGGGGGEEDIKNMSSQHTRSAHIQQKEHTKH